MSAPSSTPITTVAQAQAVVAHLIDVMDALLKIIDHETQLVRAGKLKEAAALEQAKGDLARAYVADVLQIKGSAAFVEQHQPALIRDLRHRHDTFQALLQINLTVLATAHAVAESLVRGVSAEMTRKAAPQVYGASGRQYAPPANVSVPIALTRTL